MSERTDKLAGDISQKASQLAILRGLIQHSGWKVFEEIMEQQKNLRKGEILLKPLQSTEAVYAQEFMKGEIQGLTLAQISIFAQMEVLAAEVQVASANLEKENEREKSMVTDATSGSRVDGSSFGGDDSGS